MKNLFTEMNDKFTMLANKLGITKRETEVLIDKLQPVPKSEDVKEAIDYVLVKIGAMNVNGLEEKDVYKWVDDDYAGQNTGALLFNPDLNETDEETTEKKIKRLKRERKHAYPMRQKQIDREINELKRRKY